MLSKAGILSALLRVVQACQSFGVDVTNNATIFVNTQSNDTFSFVEQFSGCSTAAAQNYLVTPDGDEIQCSDTPMTANISETSTCPIAKNQMVSGDWSIIVLSNNDDGSQVAFERDFTVTAAKQSTVYYTPVITANITMTPIVNVTATTIATNYTTLPTETIRIPSMTIDPEITVTPTATTVVRTVAAWTATLTQLMRPAVSIVWQTAYAQCTIPARQKDPPAHRALPTPRPGQSRVNPSNRNGHHYKRELERKQERKHALVKRAQDAPAVTFTDTNTAHWGTTTVTATAPALYVTSFVTSWDDIVVTPAPVTIVEGESTARLVSLTLPQSTQYINHYTIARITKTVAPTCTHTLTTTIAPTTFVSECHGRGGYIPNPVVTRQIFPGFGGAGGRPFAGQTPVPQSRAAGGGSGSTPVGLYPAAPAAPAPSARATGRPAANPWAGFNWAAWFGGRGY